MLRINRETDLMIDFREGKSTICKSTETTTKDLTIVDFILGHRIEKVLNLIEPITLLMLRTTKETCLGGKEVTSTLMPLILVSKIGQDRNPQDTIGLV